MPPKKPQPKVPGKARNQQPEHHEHPMETISRHNSTSSSNETPKDDKSEKKIAWYRSAENYIGYIFMFLIFFGGLIALGIPQPITEIEKNPLCEQIVNLTSKLNDISSDEDIELKNIIRAMQSLTASDGKYCAPAQTKPAEATLWLAIYTIADSFAQYFRIVYSFPDTPDNLWFNFVKTLASIASMGFSLDGILGTWAFICLLPQQIFYFTYDGFFFYGIIILGGIFSADERSRKCLKSNTFYENKLFFFYAAVCEIAVTVFFVVIKPEAFMPLEHCPYLTIVGISIPFVFLIRFLYISTKKRGTKSKSN